MAHQRVEVQDFFPEGSAVQNHRHLLAQLLRLHQRQDFRQFVQGAEAARKHHQRLGQVREPELAHEEVVKLMERGRVRGESTGMTPRAPRPPARAAASPDGGRRAVVRPTPAPWPRLAGWRRTRAGSPPGSGGAQAAGAPSSRRTSSTRNGDSARPVRGSRTSSLRTPSRSRKAAAVTASTPL